MRRYSAALVRLARALSTGEVRAGGAGRSAFVSLAPPPLDAVLTRFALGGASRTLLPASPQFDQSASWTRTQPSHPPVELFGP